MTRIGKFQTHSHLFPTKYAYNLSPTIKAYRETDYRILFLKGLNKKYASVRYQIMLLNPLPPINNVFFMLIQQER